MELWEKYNRTRIAGDKRTANKLLFEFIDLLKQQDKSYIKAFVDDICYKVLETDRSFLDNNGAAVSCNQYRIQHPLFKEIILPVLTEQYFNNSALHIKWIGQLEQFFYSDYKATKDFLKHINLDGNFSTFHFLEKSFVLDNRQDVLTLILNRLAQDINYYIHELPTGVLVNPDFFNAELKTFRYYLDKYNKQETWLPLLAQWENVAKHWNLYFSTQEDYSNFIDYQQRHDIKLL